MRKVLHVILPFTIGILVSIILNLTVGWWGFWVIFPWIGFSISIGILLRKILKGRKRLIGRKISIMMILPCLLLFVPIVNHENFQLGGVALLVMVGFFSKGFIHYAIAKLFGPLIWGRGFCGWACWNAAIFDWLPITGTKKDIPEKAKNIRFISLLISLAIPFYLVFILNINVFEDYIYKKEMLWMFSGNALYYAIGIPLAFIYKDKRAFCKLVCPVGLVMKPQTSISLIKIKPKQADCIECGACNKICPMDIDVMSFIKEKKPIRHTECILCSECRIVCPVNAI
jgi:ferredoxin-type protein NapH